MPRRKRCCGFFISSRDIELKPKPVRRNNKIGIADPRQGTLRRNLERLKYDQTDAGDETIVSRPTFISNVFAG